MALPVLSRALSPARATTGPADGYRPDIQGLRAVAVALVVVYHLFPDRLTGGFVGVDVFFVISGFLITGHLWRGYRETGRIGLVGFWGRRARRLVPGAVLVLVVTWLVGRIVLPTSRLADTATQVRASALYFQNWVLAHDAVDYLKSDDAASPVQHFWSLSVEEQFYLVWPLLFLLAAGAGLLVARATGGVAARYRYGVLLGLTAGVVVASLAWSVHATGTDPAAAYFVTTTRMWELGMGGLLALAPDRLTRVVGRCGPLAWVGFALIAGAAVRMDARTPFPGAAALIPVVGTVLVLAAGSSAARFGPARLTSARVPVFVGGISYALYLWHWPVIVLWTAWTGHAVGVAVGLALAAVSVGLAWLTTTFVENPVRTTRVLAGHRWRSLSTATLAAVPAVLVTVFLVGQPGPWDGRLGPDHPGAAALAGTQAVPRAAVLPPLATAAADVPEYEKQGCLGGQHDTDVTVCTFGETTDPTRTVVLVGDSMAGQWFPALQQLADQRHWKLVTMVHATCAWTSTMLVDPVTDRDYTSCRTWGAKVLDRLLGDVHPDAVVVGERVGISAAHPDSPSASAADVGAGMAAYWSRLVARGIAVVPIRETPELGRNAPDCLSGRSQARVCSVPVTTAIPRVTPITVAGGLSAASGVRVVDLNSLICGPTTCEPVVGNVLVYRDSHHLTDSYSRTLAPYLGARMTQRYPSLRA